MTAQRQFYTRQPVLFRLSKALPQTETSRLISW